MKVKATITNILIKELERNEKIILEYELELSQLPKGSIVKRKIGKNIYCYLSRREGTKVLTEYLGKNEEVDLFNLERQIEQRRRLEKYLRELRKEKKEIERAIK